MFFVVNRKHFAKIFREIFMSKHFYRLINDYFVRNIFDIEFENVNIIDNIKNLIHFIKCFEIYCQIVLKLIQFFVYKKFNRIFFVYRCRFNFFLINYIFDFVLICYKIFMYVRINETQNNSID